MSDGQPVLFDKPKGTVVRDVGTQHSGTIKKGTRVVLDAHMSGDWVACKLEERGVIIALRIGEDVDPDEGALDRLGT